MKAMKRQCALVPFLLLLGFVEYRPCPRRRHFVQGLTHRRAMRASGGHEGLGDR